MLAAVTTHLLILTLLVCPYACFGQTALSVCSDLRAPETQNRDDLRQASRPCHCCHERGAPQPASRTSPADVPVDAPRPQNPESDCLCNGAVIVADLRASDFAAAVTASPFDAPLESALPSTAGAVRFSATQARHFLPLATGREICALLCARLL